jgi:CO/xanthine dehydrogenase FAD-binding subunit
MDKLFVGVCTYLKLDSQSVYKQARVVIGSISLKPIQATGIEDGIIGKKLTDDLIKQLMGMS